MKAWTRKTAAERRAGDVPPARTAGDRLVERLVHQLPVPTSSSQSASWLSKGDLLLGLRAEPLELHPDLGVVALGKLDLEAVHRPRRNLVGGLPLEVECAGVAGAEEALLVGRQIDRAAQVGAFGVKAMTGGSLPSGWRTSQTEPTGSRGYFTQASRRSSMIANERGTPASSWPSRVSVSNDPSFPLFRNGEIT